MRGGGPLDEPSNNKLSFGQALLKNRERGVPTFKWRGRQFLTKETTKTTKNMPE